MLVPDDFKAEMANTFYDKTISVLGETTTVEADGAINKAHGTVTSTFMGNARLMNFKSVQKEYGLDYQIDITITCDVSETVAINDLIEYGGVRYEITDVLPFDSHKMIVGVKWHNQS